MFAGCQSAVLAALAGLPISAASADTAEWRSLTDRALEAADRADYRASKRLYRAAYNDTVASSAGPNAVWTTCEGLSATQATSGDMGAAARTLSDCIEHLGNLTSLETILARLSRAEVQSARGLIEEAIAGMDAIRDDLGNLTPPQRSDVLVRISDFYIAADKQASGSNALNEALDVLRQNPVPRDLAYVDACRLLIETFQTSNRRRKADDLLRETMEHIRGEFAKAPPATWELALAWRRIGYSYRRLLKFDGERIRSGRLVAEIRRWRAPPTADQGPARRRPPDDRTPPRLEKQLEPKFTRGAVAAKVQGEVLLGIEVWPDGKAHNVRVIRPLSYGLSWNAIRSVRKWEFEPATEYGKPVKASLQVKVKFRFH